MIKYFLDKLSLLRQVYLKKLDKNFYSQFGEDKILFELIPKNFKSGFYVDVGCFHHKKYSNTYLLHKRGWVGVNIDMEKEKIDLFNIARPGDYNFLGAISDKKTNIVIRITGDDILIDPYFLDKTVEFHLNKNLLSCHSQFFLLLKDVHLKFYEQR